MPEGPPLVSSFQASSSVFAGAERQRFHVELKESSNVVSWKRLLKSVPAPPGAEAPPGANPALEARLAPEAGLLSKERGASNRFSNVIEKIERLYQGQPQDSDDEVVDDQLDNVPDDDQYNTDDSFIDDEELDEYFCVDRAKTFHNGFFINKGKLENIEPSPPPVAPPKKRKRKEPSNDPSDSLKRSRKPDPPCKENLQGASLDGEPFMKVGECLVNKQVDTQTQHAATLVKGSSKGAPRSKGDQSVRNGAGKNVTSSPSKGKLFGDCKLSLATPGSAIENPPKRAAAPKVTLLERAIQDLQAGVAQFCPSVPEVQEAEQAAGAPGKTRRLPREIKQKIAKVARLAAKQGKIPDELINRLMGILGHLMQLKTLKRNLKEMVEMGLAAKQEKDGRIFHMKREFREMVHSRVSSQAKAQEGVFEDFQGIPGSSDRKILYKWDNATEDGVCELYDQYLEGTDENRGVQSRKLYMELAELWPEGWMDKDGIKNAVYRAKERRKALQKQTLNESRKKIAERIDLNDRLPEVPTSSLNLTLSNRDLPSSALQTGKPAVIRQRGLLLDKLNESKDRKRPETEAGELAFLKFRKQRAGGDEDASYQAKTSFLPRPSESLTLDGSS